MRKTVAGKALLLFCVGSVVLGVSACSGKRQGALSKVSDFSVDATVTLSVKEPERWMLPNGIEVLFLPNPELPVAGAAIYIPGGSLREPSGKNGVGEMMAAQMREGGAGNLGPEELDMALERLAAGVGAGIGAETASVSAHSLSSDFDKVFGIFADVVQRPKFSPERLVLQKGRSLEAIRRRVDNPSDVASISFVQRLYGPTPYGRVIVSSDVKQIQRSDLLKAYETLIRPERAILTVSGQLTSERVHKLVDTYFAGWNPKREPLGPLPALNYETKPGIYYVTQPVTQSTIMIGQQGVPRLSADQYNIEVFNEIFGSGGFGSRLMKRVRSELGLVYGIYGAVNPGTIKGKTFIYAQTKTASTAQAIQESIKALQDMQQNGPTSEEVVETKRVIKNSFVFRFDSPSEVLDRRATQKILGYPADYDTVHLDKIAAVTSEQVREVAQKRWDPSKFVIVVVGNEKAYSDIEQVLKTTPGVLGGLPLFRAKFGEKLEVIEDK